MGGAGRGWILSHESGETEEIGEGVHMRRESRRHHEKPHGAQKARSVLKCKDHWDIDWGSQINLED